MIYLDNAATTLHKPPQVEQAILEALHTAGNPGRGAHEPTLHAARIVLGTRLALAELFHAPRHKDTKNIDYFVFLYEEF